MKKISKLLTLLLALGGIYWAITAALNHRNRVSMQARLEGQVAVITGSSGGLGSQLVRAAARLKMKLVLTDIREGASLALLEEISKAGTEAIFIKADLSSSEERIKIVKLAVEKFGGFDLLINNAAYGYMALTELADIDAARRNFDVNFWAGVELSKLSIPVLERSPRGTIVNISSMASMVPEAWGSSTGFYSASKAALNNWTKVLSLELTPKNIRVKLVAPYGIQTDFFKNMSGESVEVAGRFIDESWANYDKASTVAEDIFYYLGDDSMVIFPGKAKYLFSISRLLYPEIR